MTLACLAVACRSQAKIAWYVLPLYPSAVAVAALVADLEELTVTRPRLGAALLLVVFAVMAPFVARNAYSFLRMQRGTTQRFYASLADRCGGDAVYADPRDSAPVHYLTLRYGMREGARGARPARDAPGHRATAGCGAPTAGLREGGYVLWMVTGTTRPAGAPQSRRGRRGAQGLAPRARRREMTRVARAQSRVVRVPVRL